MHGQLLALARSAPHSVTYMQKAHSAVTYAMQTDRLERLRATVLSFSISYRGRLRRDVAAGCSPRADSGSPSQKPLWSVRTR